MPSSQLFGQDRKLPFAAVSAMLKLGTKYEIQFLRSDAIKRLEEYFPTQLENFRNKWANSGPDSEEALSGHSIDIELAHAIPVIQLARTYNVPHILPPAFYLCAQPVSDIING